MIKGSKTLQNIVRGVIIMAKTAIEKPASLNHRTTQMLFQKRN